MQENVSVMESALELAKKSTASVQALLSQLLRKFMMPERWRIF
jgi:DNA (cytosine-5)-methyltransferase 1